MHRNLLVAAPIILLLLSRVTLVHASEPQAQTIPTTASTQGQANERGFAIWFQPVGAVLIGTLARGVYLPFGMNVPLSPRTSIVLEFTAISGNGYGCQSTLSGIWAAAGVAFSTGKDPSHNGFFVEPKLAVRHMEISGDSNWWSCPAGSGPTVRGAGTRVNQEHPSDTALSVGLDIGYQMVWGPIFFAPIVGASTGACLNCTDLVPLWKTARRDRLTLDLNLNLLRVGFTF